MNYNKEKFLNILDNLKKMFGSQNKMAESLGISSSYITKIYDKNTKNPPAPEYLKKIADNSKGVTTYRELMIICGYITMDSEEEKDELLDRFEILRDCTTRIQKRHNNANLTEEEKKIVNQYIHIIINEISAKKAFTNPKEIFKIITNALNPVREIKNIDYEKIFLYCIRETTMLITETIQELDNEKLSKDYILSNSEKEIAKSIKIPVVGTVAAGEPIFAEQNIIDYEELPAKDFSDGEYFGLKIKGDSMFPRILDGDVVIVKQQNDCDNGQVAVVLVNGCEATVKQIKKTDSGIMLIPFNTTKYEPLFFTKEDIIKMPVKIIGIVKRLIGYNFT